MRPAQFRSGGPRSCCRKATHGYRHRLGPYEATIRPRGSLAAVSSQTSKVTGPRDLQHISSIYSCSCMLLCRYRNWPRCSRTIRSTQLTREPAPCGTATSHRSFLKRWRRPPTVSLAGAGRVAPTLPCSQSQPQTWLIRTESTRRQLPAPHDHSQTFSPTLTENPRRPFIGDVGTGSGAKDFTTAAVVVRTKTQSHVERPARRKKAKTAAAPTPPLPRN